MSNSESSSTTIEELLSGRRITGFQIGIIAICAAAALVDGFDFQSISVAATLISKDIGVPAASFGPIFAIGLFGGLVGAIITGIVGDRIGRKPVLIVSLAVMTVGSGLTPLLVGFAPLMVLRFVVGLGLGGALPCVIALTSEFSTTRARSATVALMFSGYPLGAVIAGLSANVLLPRFGWESLFWICAVVPLVILVFTITSLPESVGLAARKGDHTGIQASLRRLHITQVTSDQIAPAPLPRRSSFVSVFQNGRALGTVVLSLVLMLSLLISYFLLSWIPIIGTRTGLSSSVAIVGIALVNIGSIIGGIVLGRIGARRGTWIIAAIAYVLGALAIVAIGLAGTTAPGLLLTAFLAGFLTVGAQLTVVGLSAAFFDESVRATGVGIAVGFGRVGAIIGPLLGGILLQADVAVPVMFVIIAAFSVLCAVGMVVLGVRVLRGRATALRGSEILPEALV